MTETGTNHGGVAGDQLRAFIERIERLEEEKKVIADDIKDVYAEAKGTGFDVKILRKIISLRRKQPHEREEEDAILLYTGGTTGRSKGVRLSHRNVFSNGQQCTAPMKINAGDVYLHVAPMFHSADLLG